MRSSSTEPGPTTPDPAGTSLTTDGPGTAVARLRLVLIVLLGLAALLTPRLVEHTGAVYTDRAVVSGDVWATPGSPPPQAPSPSPSAS